MEPPDPPAEGLRLRRPPAVAGAKASGVPVEAAVAASAAAEEPRWRRALRVVVRKHLLVAWKRRRFVPVFVLAVVSTCLATVWMKALKTEDDGADWRGFLGGQLGSVLFTLPMMNGVAVPLAIDIVSEKESKMKIIQSIYGLPLWLYWLTWIIYAAVMSLSSTFLVVATGCLLGTFSFSDIRLLSVVFLLGYANIIAFACCIAARQSKVRTASIIASIMAVVGQFLGMLANSCFMNLFWWPEFLVNTFVPGAGLQSAMFSVMWLEFKGLGLTRERLDMQIEAACEVKLPFFMMIVMIKLLAFGTILYATLAWWLDNITQGEFGTAKPYTFFMQRRHLCPRRRPLPEAGAGRRSCSSSLEISGLVKKFGDHVVLDRLDLSVQTGEIFALLGHNGAGKTTAFNCITGLHAPTEGSIRICGRSVEHETEEARQQLAVCPQDNPLYPEFTVERHLEFFGNLMGRDGLDKEIAEVLRAVGLSEQRQQLGEQLSGGQKRRLWVATALLGAQAVALLDEPSSGMDPVSRRDLWALILQMKAAGRSIVFTTHYLDEADSIAGRKAVMAHGRIRALGTSHELKAQFGVGYHLCIEETKSASDETRKSLADLLHSHVADASVDFEGGKARCVIPFTALPQVGPLLTAFESKRAALASGDYSIQMTSLEDVFMELGRQADVEAQTSQALPEGMTEEGTSAREPQTPFQRVPVYLVDMVFMFCWMRLAAFRRNKKMFWWYVFLPICIISVSIPEKDETREHQPGIMLLGFVLAGSGAVSNVVKDVNRKCKHVALSQGLSHNAYWLGTFMADYLQLLVPSLSLLLAMLQKEYPIMKLPGALPVILAECFAYPVGVLLVCYHASFYFSNPDSAVKLLPLVMISLNAFQASAMNVPNRGVELAVVILVTTMAMFNPLYSLEGTFVILDLNQKILKKQGEDWLRGTRETPPDTERMDVPIHYWPLLCGVFVTYPILAAWLLLREASVRTPSPAAVAEEEEVDCSDEEVLNEANRRIPSDLALVRGLKHNYGKLRAVRGITFGLRSGECFGLLGPNGAGKTTTLAALTGEIQPSAGTIHMLGHEVAAGRRVPAVCCELGLCTQIDPLWDDMTGREHLVFYGLIKGIPDEELEKSAQAVLQRLGFSAADADKAVGTYSGGMRRKLSIGIAIVGRPRILMLDEPTTAVDAVGKRHLWSILQARGPDQSAILMTHSMEEAEALCSRIAIQVRGRFRCLGTALRLKLRYGSEYLVEIVLDAGKAPDEHSSEVSDFMRKELSEQATLVEQHGDHVVYRVPLKTRSEEDSLTVGKVFMQLGKWKDKLGLLSYCVNQPTLDQVFLRLAREQEEAGSD